MNKIQKTNGKVFFIAIGSSIMTTIITAVAVAVLVWMIGYASFCSSFLYNNEVCKKLSLRVDVAKMVGKHVTTTREREYLHTDSTPLVGMRVEYQSNPETGKVWKSGVVWEYPDQGAWKE